MEQYIPKSALLVEIERLKDELKASDSAAYVEAYIIGAEHTIKTISDVIDTLEVKGLPIWEKVSPDTGQTTLYKDGGKSYLERFGYRIELKDLDKLPKKNLKAQKGEEV